MCKRVGWLAGLVTCALGQAAHATWAHDISNTNRLNGDWGQVTMSWRF